MENFNKVADFYNRRVDEYGYDPKSCDYGRPSSQKRKFEIISEVLDLNGLSLLDIGCGFADYAKFLSEKYNDLTYEGIDLSSKMINTAKLNNPTLKLSVGNIIDDPISLTETHDIVSANGIFYLLGPNAKELMKKLVIAMFNRAKIAVSFNSLSYWSEFKEKDEFYADPLETLAWCKEISPWVVLRHDYMHHDFTIYIYKRQPY